MRCPVCLALFDWQAQQENHTEGCPVCKTTLHPMMLVHDGYVQINWQEMRMLCTFANRWMAGFQNTKENQDTLKAFVNLLNRITKNQPPGVQPLVPNIDPVIVEMQEKLKQQRQKEVVELPKDAPINLAPNADGKIISPFFKKNI